VKSLKIAVVGAGPAGMMAAIRASQLQAQVTLIERNPSLGRKLLLSGKGRCNLTNASGLEEYLRRFFGQGDFLRDAFKKFFHQQLIDFFQSRGLKLKVERQNRVFPVTDNSGSILEILEKELRNNKVEIRTGSRAVEVIVEHGRALGLRLQGAGQLLADKIILATGGVSYSFAGSTGDGLEMARKLAHKITELRPGLVALEVKEKFCLRLQGLALKNIRLKVNCGKRRINSEIGELVFTDFGISGPLVLSLSAKVADCLAKGISAQAGIDLKPALSLEQLDARILREIRLNRKKNLRNTLKTLLPLKLIDVFAELLKINPLKTANQLNQPERRQVAELLKNFPLIISRCRPIEGAMITHGGISLKEINPRSMESRRVKGLYFCGEMIDVDADTGGFNLQAAFSTGYLAGESAATPTGDGSQ